MAENVNLVGAIASIIAFLIVAGTIVYKLITKYRRIKIESEKQYQDQFNRYEAASRTIGARTDLGFFLLNTLGRYRKTVLDNTIMFTFNTLGSVLAASLGLLILITSAFNTPTAIIVLVFAVSALLLFIFAMVYLILTLRYESLERRFDEYFRRLWETPIQKHVDRQTEPCNEAK